MFYVLSSRMELTYCIGRNRDSAISYELSERVGRVQDMAVNDMLAYFLRQTVFGGKDHVLK